MKLKSFLNFKISIFIKFIYLKNNFYKYNNLRTISYYFLFLFNFNN